MALLLFMEQNKMLLYEKDQWWSENFSLKKREEQGPKCRGPDNNAM